MVHLPLSFFINSSFHYQNSELPCTLTHNQQPYSNKLFILPFHKLWLDIEFQYDFVYSVRSKDGKLDLTIRWRFYY